MKKPMWYSVAVRRAEKLWCWSCEHWIKASIFVLGPIAFATEQGAAMINAAACLFALWFFSLAFADKDPNANILLRILQRASANIVHGIYVLLAMLIIAGMFVGLVMIKAIDIRITIEELQASPPYIEKVVPDSLF